MRLEDLDEKRSGDNGAVHASIGECDPALSGTMELVGLSAQEQNPRSENKEETFQMPRPTFAPDQIDER